MLTESGVPPLVEFIRHRIRQSSEGRISFVDYMDWVLYHPDLGYYSRDEIQLGRDFMTSPQLGADFAQLLAEQFVEMWQILGRPDPFTLVEMGAGSGVLMADVIAYVFEHQPEFWQALQVVIVERSTALFAQQVQRLFEVPQPPRQVSWIELAKLEPVVGCFFSNELVDAFPVHPIVIQGGQVQEVYVEEGSDGFQEVIADPSTPELATYLSDLGIDVSQYPDGYRTEINLLALDWMKSVAEKLAQGFVLTIDYGYSAERYYHPARSQGTLLSYHRHTTGSTPYERVGLQDLTAHVNFTALQQVGEQAGLETVGMVPQYQFLASLGLLDRMAALSEADPADWASVISQRQALHWLVDPMGLGNFLVLVQAKGLATPPCLRGLVNSF